MTPQELEVIRESHQQMRVKKSKDVVIACPFHDCSAFDSSSTKYLICDICHKWMGTKRKSIEDRNFHPCDQIPQEEVLKRYWQSVIYGTKR